MWNQERLYGIYRQASGIVPKNVLLDKEYIEIELQYRDIRTQTQALTKHLEEIKTFEHGGPTYKIILESLEKVKGKQKTNEDDDLSDNFYNVGEEIFKQLAKSHAKKENRTIAEKLMHDNKSMHNLKHDFNMKIKSIIQIGKDLKKKTVEIDNDRTVLKNVQFKAERAFEDVKTKNPNEDARASPEVKRLLDEVAEREKKCKSEMKKFNEDDAHNEMLAGLHKAYVWWYETTLGELKNIK